MSGFGKLLRGWRETRRLSQEKLALAAEVSLSACLATTSCRYASVDHPRLDPSSERTAPPSTPPICSPTPHAELQRRLDNGPLWRGDSQEFRHLGVSPDGRLLAASHDRRTLIIDVAAGVQVASIAGANARFSGDGRSIFVAFRTEILRVSLPDLTPAEEYLLPEAARRPPLIEVNPTNDRIVAFAEGGDAPVHVWDLPAQAPRCSSPDPLGSIVFAARSGSAWGCDGDSLVEWSPEDCRIVRRWPTSRCTDIAVSSDGARVALEHGSLLLFDVATGSLIPHYLGRPSVGPMRALSNGDIVVASGGLRLFDPLAEKPTTRRILGPHDEFRVIDLAVSADESVAVAFFEDPEYRELNGVRVRVWSIREGRHLGVLPGAPRMLEPKEIAPHGEAFLSAEAHLSLDQTGTGELLADLGPGPPRARFSGDGALLLVHDGRSLLAHDGRSGALLRTYSDVPTREYDKSTAAFVVSSDGAHAFLGESNGRHLLISLADGGLATLREPGARVGEIEAVFSPDSRWLLVRPTAGGVSLWDVRTRRRTRRLGDVEATFGLQPFSGDGGLVALEGEHESVIFEAASGRPRHRFPGWTGPALSKDGRHLLAIDEGGRPGLFDVAAGRLIHRLSVSGALRVSFDARGTIAVSTSRELSIWSLDTARRLAVYPTPYEGRSVPLADDRRLAVEDQSLVIYSAKGALEAGHAVTADGERRVAWASDGAWDGDVGLLAFSESLVPCVGIPARRVGLWSAALRR
ncbi:MAG: WD40 repeat domain-containing protein [Nannocystaceae bacterium]